MVQGKLGALLGFNCTGLLLGGQVGVGVGYAHLLGTDGGRQHANGDPVGPIGDDAHSSTLIAAVYNRRRSAKPLLSPSAAVLRPRLMMSQ